MSSSRQRTNGPRNLRGKHLQEAAIRELEDTESWRDGTPLTWFSLATRLHVSRQAIAAKPAVLAAYHAAKGRLKESKGTSPEAVKKRTLKEKIEELEKRLQERDRQLDAWVQKWATIEYNCRLHSYNPDKLLASRPKPLLPER